MRKQVLKKIAKGASITLLAGAMVCGASLTNVNANANSSAASEESGIRSGKYNGHNLGATAPTAKNNKVNKNSKRTKGDKKSIKKSKKAKHSKKGAKKNTKKVNKRASKAAAKKAALKRAKRLARRNRAEEPMNRRGYRHANKRNASAKRVHAFRKSAYYRNTWSKALKINKKGIRKDEKAKKFDQKRGYKYAAKYLQNKINYLNGYVRHDVKMLNLR